MIDPTFIMPDSMKQRLVDGLAEALARRAEQLGSEWAAENIRKLSSEAPFRTSADHALKAGAMRFVDEYREEDEDLVDEIMADTVFWQSTEFQRALLEMVQRPGAWMPDETDIVVRHFEWVQPQRLNRKRVDKAVSRLLVCIAQELWGLPGAREVREVYALQFQKLTAEAAREQVALLRQQLEATAQANQLSGDVLQALLQLTTAIEKNLLATPAVPALVASPKPYNNLPQPTYVRFVGRDAELAWMRERLSPADRAWQIAINGIGGVGKTALALAIADEYRRGYHEMPAEERFEAIIWVSAKEEVLTAQGRERADLPEAILHTLEDVYTAIARVLEREDITRALPEEQDALVQKALQRQRTLLVMDNMESVEDDRIKAFLRKLPAPTKAIITSRDWIDVADVRVLRGLSPEDAETLIREEAAVREVALNTKQRERLYDLTAGLPLPLKLGIARMSAGESFAAVERWLGDAVGDLPEYCAKTQVDFVCERNLGAWALLLTCALFDREYGASRDALGAVANLSIKDRDDSLALLQKLFLVNRTEADRFWVLPIVERYTMAQLASSESKMQLIGDWLGWLVQVAQDHGIDDLYSGLENLHILALEYSNLLAGIRLSRLYGRWYQLFELAKSVWPYAYVTGLSADMEEVVDAISAAIAAHDDEHMKCWVETRKGRLAMTRGTYDAATTHLNTAESIASRLGEVNDLALIWLTKMVIDRRLGNIDTATSHGLRVFELGLQVNDPYVQFAAADQLAALSAKTGDFVQADLWTDKAEGLLQAFDIKRIEASVYYRRGMNSLMQGDYVAAEALLLEALDWNVRHGLHRYVAHDKLGLATVYANTNRNQLAQQYAEEARDLFERLGAKLILSESELLIESLAGPASGLSTRFAA